MSLTSTNIPVSRCQFHEYYVSTTGAVNLSLDESLNPEKAFELDAVRLHLSVATASVVDFRIYLSSILGSAHNLVLLSLAMSGVADVYWGYDRTFRMNYGDQLVFSLVLSTGIVVGLHISGWSITA